MRSTSPLQFYGRFSYNKMENEQKLIRIYRCESRVKCANGRFEDKISTKDVLFALQKNDFKCFYCNDTIDKNSWQLDHFYPRAMSGKNEKTNLVACCKWCNTMKNALDGNSFINKCNQIVNNNFFELNGAEIEFSDKISNKKYSFIKRLLVRLNVDENVIKSIDHELKNMFFKNRF